MSDKPVPSDFATAQQPGGLTVPGRQFLQWIADQIDALYVAIAGVPSVTPTTQEFTASGVFTNSTASPILLEITATAPGGGGGGVTTTGGDQGGGGGAGENIYRRPWLLAPAATLTVTIGAVGTGGALGDNDGANGGDVTLADGTRTVTLQGGRFGSKGSVKTGGLGGGRQAGGVAANSVQEGFYTRAGAGGQTGGAGAGFAGGQESFYQVQTGTSGGSGGSSMFGLGGLGPSANGPGGAVAASAYGAGGAGALRGGSATAQPGSDGGGGYVRLQYEAVT